MTINWKSVVRDKIFILVLTVISGAIVLKTANYFDFKNRYVITIAHLLLGSFFYCIVGYMAPSKRWKHLFVVSICVWLAYSPLCFFGASFIKWLLLIKDIAIKMGIGGSLSYLFVKTPEAEQDQ